MKRIILHGAINTSNFGDVLFATLFYKKYKSIGYDVYFTEFPKYGVGDFVRNELDYIDHIKLKEQLNADIFVFISGGYFGDNKKSIKLSIRRWIRYALPGLVAVLKKKDIYVLGVSGGPLHSWFNRKSFKFILENSKQITVRDEDTKNFFESIGIVKPITVTADTAITIDKSMLPKLDIQSEIDYITHTNGKKKLFIHLVGNKEIDDLFANNVAPAIKVFLEKNSDYCVVFGTDGIYDANIKELKTFQVLEQNDYYIYKYHSAWMLCSLLEQMDFIVTPKLHVGIISSTLGKSVVSFPEHEYKTKRFYSQIEEAERCLKLRDCSVDEAYRMMQEFHNKPITIDSKLIKLASENFGNL